MEENVPVSQARGFTVGLRVRQVKHRSATVHDCCPAGEVTSVGEYFVFVRWPNVHIVDACYPGEIYVE